jgi:hypothetical protein
MGLILEWTSPSITVILGDARRLPNESKDPVSACSAVDL